MTLTWSVIALLFSVAAMVLAGADGAILSTGLAAPRGTPRDAERAHRALAMARVIAHLVTGVALILATVPLRSARLAVATAVTLLLLHVTLVEGMARGAGAGGGTRVVERMAPFVGLVALLFYPVTWLGASVEGMLRSLLPPADGAVARRAESAEQFREVIAAEADVTAAEEQLLHGVFSLGDTQVQEIMVPRVDVVGIEVVTPWSEVLDRVRSSGHARLPVFEETLDNIVGILYAKDLLPAVVAEAAAHDWMRLVRPAQFIPATKPIDQQLRDFKAQRTHIAVVVDEYGGTAGIVTIEDVLEEIVGEIRDEYDEEEPSIVQEGRDRFWVAGGVSLGDLSELVGTDLQHEGLTTVAGLVYEVFGRVPRAGESREVSGFRVVVERVRRRRIQRVYLERIAARAGKRA